MQPITRAMASVFKAAVIMAELSSRILRIAAQSGDLLTGDSQGLMVFSARHRMDVGVYDRNATKHV